MFTRRRSHSGGECRCTRPRELLAAFPKKSRCGECGEKGAASVKTEQSVNPGALLSPSRSSFRVNKANGRPSSRKQPYGTALDRVEHIDPDTYNIIGNGVSNGMPMEHGFMNFEAPPPFPPPMMDPMYSANYPYTGPTMPPSHHDGNMMGHPTMPMMNGDLVAAHGSGTREGTVGYSAGSSSVVFTPSMSAAPSARANPPTAQRSCCASKQVAEDSTEMNGYNSITVPSVGHHTSPQPPTAALQHLELFPSSMPTNEYGTFSSPLQFKQWTEGYYGQPPNQETSTHDVLPYGCSCGATCACLACPTHPFNPTNRDTVNLAYSYLSQNNQDAMLPFDDGTSPALQDGNSPFATQSSTPEAGEAGSHVASSMEGSPAPPASAKDYLWVHVPCQGDESSCNKKATTSLQTEENSGNQEV
ncbi:hypothetical protein PG987_009115 [Apiospora arundinis]